jgi:hypothetical protein
MNTYHHSNKLSSIRSNGPPKSQSFNEGSHDTSLKKKRSLSDGCIDLQILEMTTRATKQKADPDPSNGLSPSLTVAINSPSLTCLPVENAPVPAAFQDTTGIGLWEKKAKGFSDVRIDIPEVIDGDQEAPIPSERMETLFTPDSFKSKNDAARRANHYRPDAHRGSPIPTVQRVRDSNSSYSTNKSIASSSKDRLSAKSSNAELAVAQPVRETDTIYEAHQYEPVSKQPIYKNRRCRLFTVLALLVITVIVAVTVYYTTRKPCCEVQYEIQTMKPMTLRESRILHMIEDNVLERNTTFSSMGISDPQYLALEWIMYDDKLQLTIDDTNLPQRYILAVLAFALDLYSWECGMVKGLASCNTADDFDDYAPWLSRTNECHWYGVECDNGVDCGNGIITGLDLCELRF